MEKEKTMRDIYYELKELRKNPTTDNIEKIEKIDDLYRELISRHDFYEDYIDTSCCILDHVTVITLILVSVLLLILCIKVLFFL